MSSLHDVLYDVSPPVPTRMRFLDQMHPRPGIPLDTITTRLRELARTVYEPTEPDGFALWVSQAEAALRECFVEVPLERLFTERYWRLTTGPVQRSNEMRSAEQTHYAEWLASIQSTVATMTSRYGTPSAIGVLDTNVLMHAKPLSDIDWLTRVGADAVQLVVPLRVVDELDERKYGRRDDMRTRARKRIRLLGRYLSEEEPIRPNVTIQVVGWRDLDLGGINRPPVSPDLDILDTAEALRVYASAAGLSVITGDVGMQIRADERCLPVTFLDPEDMADAHDPQIS